MAAPAPTRPSSYMYVPIWCVCRPGTPTEEVSFFPTVPSLWSVPFRMRTHTHAHTCVPAPQADGLVVGPGHDRSPVRRHSNCRNPTSMPLQGVQQLTCDAGEEPGVRNQCLKRSAPVAPCMLHQTPASFLCTPCSRMPCCGPEHAAVGQSLWIPVPCTAPPKVVHSHSPISPPPLHTAADPSSASAQTSPKNPMANGLHSQPPHNSNRQKCTTSNKSAQAPNPGEGTGWEKEQCKSSRGMRGSVDGTLGP